MMKIGGGNGVEWFPEIIILARDKPTEEKKTAPNDSVLNKKFIVLTIFFISLRGPSELK